jgi:putative DNA primase/helicase
MMPSVFDLVQGKWRGILLQLGVDEKMLNTKRHGPCPMCGGTDRFRFTNFNDRGSYVCNQCGPGDGWKLIQGIKGWDMKQSRLEVQRILGDAAPDPKVAVMTPERRKQMLVDTWRGSVPVSLGDVVDRYLTARGVNEPVAYPKALRTHPDLYCTPSLSFPAMLASVVDVDGKGVTLHRTWLGEGVKAPVEEPRKLMPGDIPDGACVRLGDVQECIGIAEGIETALAASHRYEMPVWAAISAGMMQKWTPPPDVAEVVIFGDNDESFTGHAAAYLLAKKLKARGLIVSVHIPAEVGTDWADFASATRKSR